SSSGARTRLKPSSESWPSPTTSKSSPGWPRKGPFGPNFLPYLTPSPNPEFPRIHERKKGPPHSCETAPCAECLLTRICGLGTWRRRRLDQRRGVVNPGPGIDLVGIQEVDLAVGGFGVVGGSQGVLGADDHLGL